MWWAREVAGVKSDAAAIDKADGPLAFAAVVAFTCILIVAPQNWIPALKPLRIAFLSASFATASLVWEQWRNRKTPGLTGEIAICFAILAWAFATVPLSYWPGGSVSVLTDVYIKSVVVFWLLVNVVTTKHRLRFLAILLMLCSLPLAITGVYNSVTGKFVHDTDTISRIVGYGDALTGNPNDLALMINLLLPLSIAVFLSAKGKSVRMLALIVIVADIFGVVVTFSRAGFLGLATVATAYFFQMVKRRGADRAWAFTILLSALIAFPLLPSNYVERVATVTSVESDTTGSSQIRWRDSVAAVHFVMQHPIIGAGIGMDWLALNQVRGEKWYKVHNVYLQYAVDLGLPGFLLFLLLLFSVLAAVRASRRRLASLKHDRDLFLLVQALEISIMVFVICGVFYPAAYHFYFYYIGGLGLAASTITHRTLTVAPS